MHVHLREMGTQQARLASDVAWAAGDAAPLPPNPPYPARGHPPRVNSVSCEVRRL
jgi:hypothetical protein